MKMLTEWIGDWIDLEGIDDRAFDETLTRIGHAVEGVETSPAGRTVELEITTNRIDAMSHRGMARELAAAVDRKVRPVENLVDVEGLDAWPVSIEAPAMCGRFAALAIDGVEVRPSSEKIRRRLESVGLRPLNNIVDATNYVMLELGHPLHAFDRERLEGDRIVVRPGREGEKLTTLDGVERTVDPRTVVIDDGTRGVGLGGIMGGENSEIDKGTTRVLLECAWFDPVTIRLASRRLNLNTDASYRFERRVDPGDAAEAIRRCAALIIDEAGGAPFAFSDEIVNLPEPTVVEVRAGRIAMFSGGAIGLDESQRILEGLGMRVEPAGESLRVAVPSWRGDIASEIDLIEEILRIHGYDEIPAALPRLSTGDVRRDEARELEERVRDVLVSLGLSEVITYSFMRIDQLAEISEEEPLIVENALSENTAAMRTSIIPGLLEAAASNWSYGNRQGAIFEAGRTYHELRDGTAESARAAIALWGARPGHWDEKSRDVDFFDARGVVDELAERIGAALEWEPASLKWARDGYAAAASIDGERVAVVGQIDSGFGSRLGLKTTVVAAEISLEPFLKARPVVEMQEVSRYPGVPMAFAFRHDPDLSWTEIRRVLEAVRPEELADYGLWDRFASPDDEQVKTTLAMWYQVLDRSLSQEEVEKTHEQLKKTIASKLPIESE
ncbi:MAG: phenylalanine--tRNA ligase subunit beta [Acidobacteria bacterium]|nr:phenylalanine--tRNA ligase subunit beta [Acidobacteriota bacterium]